MIETRLGATAKRFINVMKQEPRKTTMLRGLSKDQPDFERALGQLFFWNGVRWSGRTKGRKLALKRRA